ncbi:type II toxin-antitoxin system RelB/DinJ family antitoxin [Enterococcus cecorum]|uniref:type II toxin-antitoxin system RelB/DinJ family antitoxin n=1 Tax=Enterococcus cecorum TaxID=44008 RepID=UPI00200B95B1|nr:type II toxin-antitoxin system RelB/DinJ family antitoxin [Enterococcus cecorum]
MALIRIEISDLLKKEAESILLSQGMTPQEAVQTLYKKIVAKGEFPKELQLTEEEINSRFDKVMSNFAPEPLNTKEEIEAWLNEE